MRLQNKNYFCPNYRSKITSCIFCTNFAPFPKTSHSKTIPQSFVFCLCAWSHKDMILVAEFYTSFSGHIISISYTLSLKLVFRRTMKSFGIKQHFNFVGKKCCRKNKTSAFDDSTIFLTLFFNDVQSYSCKECAVPNHVIFNKPDIKVTVCLS